MNTVAKLEKDDVEIIQREANLEKVADFCNIFNMIKIYYKDMLDWKEGDEIDIAEAEEMKRMCYNLSYKLRDIQEALQFTVIDKKWTKEDKLDWFNKFIKANSVDEKLEILKEDDNKNTNNMPADIITGMPHSINWIDRS